MTGIFFRPDKTQIVKAKAKQAKKILIKKVFELKSYYGCFESEAEKEEIKKVFRSLETEAALSGEDIYLVFPDEKFELVDTANITSEEEMERVLKESIGKSKEEFYISTPFHSTPGTYNKKTIYAIRKNFADKIIQAADELNIQISSIEAESMATMRAAGDWRKEKILLTVYRKSVEIISYSPLGGIFRLETNLSGEKFIKEPEKAEKKLKAALTSREIAAEYTFSSINTQIPVNILGEPEMGMKIKLSTERRGKAMEFQSCVENEGKIKNASDWLGAVGTLLQVCGEDSEIYADCPKFLKISSGNILPEEVQVGARMKHWQQILKKVLKKAAIIMVAGLALTGIGITYFGSIQISTELQERYDKAKANEESLNQEIRIIELAKKENENLVEGFRTLLDYRNENMYLTNFSIGGTQGADTANNWIKFTAVSEDPIIFQDLLVRLREEKRFKNCNLTEISGENGGFARAHFNLGKGSEEKE